MQVRACQIGGELGDPTARMAAIRWLAIDAASDGADVVVFPELALTGYGAGEDIGTGAESVEGSAAREIQRLADENRIAVVVGMAIREERGLLNAALVARPSLPPIVYAKQHLYEAYEKALFVPGTTPSPIFLIAGMKAGVLVCFDVEFPERVRELAQAGAEVIFVPTALPKGPTARYVAETVVPVRAFENQIFIVYVDHFGAEDRFTYQGLSCIAAPDGSRITFAPEDKPGMLSATLDLGDFDQSRRENPYLRELALHPRS